MLRDYQKLVVNHIISHPRCNIWLPMGMGKTLSTLTALSRMYDTGLIKGPTLVIAPLRVAKITWPAEVAKWPSLCNLRVRVISGGPLERSRALSYMSDSNLYTINLENIPWLITHFSGDFPFETVVVDESTKLKSYRSRGGSKRALALSKIAHTKVSRWINLTGTPSPNGLEDLWGQNYFVDSGRRLGKTFTKFSDTWFTKLQYPGQQWFKLKPMTHAQKGISDKLSDVTMSLDVKDWFDIAEPIVTDIFVELPKAAKALYRDMEQDMFCHLRSGEGVEALNVSSKVMKCLQLSSGSLYTEGGKFEEVHSEKLEALASIVEESAGMPLLVAYHFKSDLARILERFPQAVPLDTNPATISRWDRGEIPMLLVHPASAGHGLNLQDGGNTIVFFSHWWDLEQYQQVIERIGPTRQAQSGHARPVYIIHIIAKDTVDELVVERRKTKGSVQDILLKAMNLRDRAADITH